jgi:hypothetical protein
MYFKNLFKIQQTTNIRVLKIKVGIFSKKMKVLYCLTDALIDKVRISVN